QNKVILLHNNVRPHIALPTWEILIAIGSSTVPGIFSQILPHRIFTYFYAGSMQRAQSLSGTQFRNIEKVQFMDNVIHLKSKGFFHRGIHLLSERWQKVVGNAGNHF
ncbi:Histone-lysine N-methyltransferase SETMAR, partial [Harpegnathos saltator]